MDGSLAFGHWLKQRRKAQDLTQQELARLVGCAVVTIQKIEEGERRPSKQVADRLAQQLGIPAEERGSFLRFARAPSAADQPATPPLRLDTATNLPTPLTPLIGRGADVAAVRERLMRDDVRLLTLVGPPGVGKTRLSIQVAGELYERFPDGVWFVALAAIDDPDLVAPTIAHVLELTEAGTQPLIEQLKAALRPKRTLLVLDNVEQIMAAAPVITGLLPACRLVKVLATSRTPLHVYGEHEYTVEPLTIPTSTSSLTPEGLIDYAGVQLFVARVQAFKSDFALTAANAPAITEICVRLDGLPLAIELAAAQMRHFTPEAFVAHLNRQADSPFLLLGGGPRDLPARQQTLHNAMSWSYVLLDGPAQQLFRRMGVFVGGSSMAAVSAVCGCAYPRDLAALVEQSLVRHELRRQAEPRLSMLEMIREYALVELAESGERAQIEQAHAAYFLEQAEDVQEQAGGLGRMKAAPLNLLDAVTRRTGLDTWLDRMEADHDNVRAALRWSLAHDVATGLRLCTALWWFWEAHGYWSEGRRWTEAMLTAVGDGSPVLRMRALECLGSLAWKQGDYAQASVAMSESLALCQALGATSTAAYPLMILGQMALEQGNYPQAASLLHESLALKRGLGEPASWVLIHLAQLALAREDYGEAQQLGEESLEAAQQAGDSVFPALALRVLGETALAQGDYKRARTLLKESVARSRSIRHRRMIGFALTAFAGAVASGREPSVDDLCAAARIWGAAEKLRDEVGIFLPVAEYTRYERAISDARRWVAPEVWAAAWAEGRAMSLEQAIVFALSLPELAM